MFIEIDLGRSRSVDTVRVYTRDGTGIQMRLEGMDTEGKWAVASSESALPDDVRLSFESVAVVSCGASRTTQKYFST